MELKRIAIVVCALTLMLVGCDPQKLINDYFAKQGLNPLAVVRDDIKPGALIISNKGKNVFTDSIFDYSPVARPTTSDQSLSETKDFNAVLKKYESDRNVSGSVAADFLKSVLPVDISADLGLTNSVTIDLINAKGHRIKPVEIQNYLRNNGKGLQDFLSTQESGVTPFVAYETYEADTLSIKSQSGTDVSSKVDLSQEFKPLSSGSASFKYKRTSKEELIVKGDKPYVFAVRAAKLVLKNGVYVPQVTNFASGDVKAVGGEEKYSAPIQSGFGLLSLEPAKK